MKLLPATVSFSFTQNPSQWPETKNMDRPNLTSSWKYGRALRFLVVAQFAWCCICIDACMLVVTLFMKRGESLFRGGSHHLLLRAPPSSLSEDQVRTAQPMTVELQKVLGRLQAVAAQRVALQGHEAQRQHDAQRRQGCDSTVATCRGRHGTSQDTPSATPTQRKLFPTTHHQDLCLEIRPSLPLDPHLWRPMYHVGIVQSNQSDPSSNSLRIL